MAKPQILQILKTKDLGKNMDFVDFENYRFWQKHGFCGFKKLQILAQKNGFCKLQKLQISAKPWILQILKTTNLGKNMDFVDLKNYRSWQKHGFCRFQKLWILAKKWILQTS